MASNEAALSSGAATVLREWRLQTSKTETRLKIAVASFRHSAQWRSALCAAREAGHRLLQLQRRLEEVERRCWEAEQEKERLEREGRWMRSLLQWQQEQQQQQQRGDEGGKGGGEGRHKEAIRSGLLHAQQTVIGTLHTWGARVKEALVGGEEEAPQSAAERGGGGAMEVVRRLQGVAVDLSNEKQRQILSDIHEELAGAPLHLDGELSEQQRRVLGFPPAPLDATMCYERVGLLGLTNLHWYLKCSQQETTEFPSDVSIAEVGAMVSEALLGVAEEARESGSAYFDRTHAFEEAYAMVMTRMGVLCQTSDNDASMTSAYLKHALDQSVEWLRSEVLDDVQQTEGDAADA